MSKPPEFTCPACKRRLSIIYRQTDHLDRRTLRDDDKLDFECWVERWYGDGSKWRIEKMMSYMARTPWWDETNDVLWSIRWELVMGPDIIDNGKLMTTTQISTATGIPKRTLRRMRSENKGPNYYQPNERLILYKLSEVQDWLREVASQNPRQKDIANKDEL